jgi:hypothetical protein
MTTGSSSSSGDKSPQLVGYGALDRSLYVGEVSDVAEWPDELNAPRPHFVVLLAMDATHVDAASVTALAKKLLDQGMVYLCAWGPGSSRVHDIFDDVEIEREASTDAAFLMTTWHEGEDLDDTLWFAVVSAVPAEDYIETCRAVLAIVVDQPEWKERVVTAFGDFEKFEKEILAGESASDV